MFNNLTSKFFGSSNDRQIKRYRPIVDKINELEEIFINFSDEELRLKTNNFREQLSNGETLEKILPEVFATVREAAKRTLNQRHFDVQLIGGLVLHEGKIAEMKTGEGKTLVSTLACYLNALGGNGVGHAYIVITHASSVPWTTSTTDHSEIFLSSLLFEDIHHGQQQWQAPSFKSCLCSREGGPRNGPHCT